jgi:SPP1 gp7 family putative phage head morphogenesis protein
MAIWDGITAYFRAATPTQTLPPQEEAAPNAIPLPARYRTGAYPNWSAMINAASASVQPVKPDEAREGRDNSIVSICLHWIATSWLVATPQVGVMNGKDFTPLPGDHPFLATLQDPISGDTYDDMCWSMLTDYIQRGNCYAYKLRNNNNQILGYEVLPARYIRPIPDNMGRLWYYAYSPYGGTAAGVYAINAADIIHIKHGRQEDFPLLGVSPLAAQYREIVTDNTYSDFAAGLGRNGGVPPIVFTPRLLRTNDGETVVDMDAETAKELSDNLNERFRAEPGRTRIIPGALEMHQTGIDPDKMALTEVRAMPETRIPAALGLPAALLQLYTGLQKSTDNNIKESIKQGWRGCMIPLLRHFAGQFTVQCLRADYPDAQRKRLVMYYDTSDVPELADDAIAVRDAARADFLAGMITLEEARAERGLVTDNATVSQLAPVPAVPTKARTKNLGGKTADIYSVANAYRAKLMAQETDALNELSGLWDDAQTAIDARLSDLLSDLQDLQESGVDPTEYQTRLQSRLQDLMRQIDDEMATLTQKGATRVTDGQRQMVQTAAANAEPFARAAIGSAPPSVSLPWNTLPATAFETMVGLSSNGSPLDTLFAEMSGDMKREVRQSLLDGIAQGLNPADVARRMAAITGESRSRTETIARTEMLRASREATRQIYAANEDVVTGYVRLAAEDMRTCVACWALSGSESPTGAIMPQHPSCRCVMIPKVKSWAEITGDDSLPDDRPVIATGEANFASLTDSEQREVLGEARYGLYKDGVPLRAFVQVYNHPEWGASVRIRNLQETAQ